MSESSASASGVGAGDGDGGRDGDGDGGGGRDGDGAAAVAAAGADVPGCSTAHASRCRNTDKCESQHGTLQNTSFVLCWLHVETLHV
jgi:hypothetical protein